MLAPRVTRGFRRLLLVRALAAELIGTFALVFAGAGAIIRRPHFGRALQPRRLVCVCADAPLFLDAAARLLGCSAVGRAARCSNSARLARQPRSRRRDPSRRLAGASVPVGGGADVLLDVRDHECGDRYARRRRGCGNRDRRHSRSRRDARRACHRRIDESGALARSGARLRRVQALWLYIAAPLLRGGWRHRVPVRAPRTGDGMRRRLDGASQVAEVPALPAPERA